MITNLIRYFTLYTYKRQYGNNVRPSSSGKVSPIYNDANITS